MQNAKGQNNKSRTKKKPFLPRKREGAGVKKKKEKIPPCWVGNQGVEPRCVIPPNRHIIPSPRHVLFPRHVIPLSCRSVLGLLGSRLIVLGVMGRVDCVVGVGPVFGGPNDVMLLRPFGLCYYN